MYCIESLLGRWSTLRRTRRLGIDSAEILLPREQRVVDLERAAADLDRAFHAPRRQAGVDVAEAAVERLRPGGGCAHGEAEAVVTTLRSLLFGGVHERGPEAAAPPARQDFHVADLGRVPFAEVRMADRPGSIPGDEVEGATTKGEPREPEAGADHGVHVLRRERPDRDHRSLDRKVSAPALSSMSFRLPHFGLWTHDGQPSAHGQPPIMCAVSATQPSNCAKPRCVIPTPPGWPSYTNTVGRPVWKWRFVERPPMSQRSHIAHSGSIAIIACSAACSVASRRGISSSPSSCAGSGRYQTASVANVDGGMSSGTSSIRSCDRIVLRS